MLEEVGMRGVVFFVRGKFAFQAPGFLYAERLMSDEVDSFPYASPKGGGKTRARLGLEMIWADALRCSESTPLPRRPFHPNCIATDAKKWRSMPVVQLAGLQVAEEMRGSTWFMAGTLRSVENRWVVLLPNLTEGSPARVTSRAPAGPYGRG